MRKKIVSVLLCASMAAAVFTGCGGSSDSSSSSTSTESSESGSTAATGQDGTFTYCIGGDTGNTLNPMTADDRWGLMTCHLLYAPPFFINPDGTKEFILAESFEPSEDGLSYTMKLKDGLKWSDGEPITADDVVYTYDEKNKINENMFIAGQPVKVEKVDDTTVKFTLPEVCASAEELLVSEFFILPKHIFEGKGTFDINMLEEQVVGAGPYTLEEYKTGEYLKFKKNPNYANGEANVDTVVFRIIEKSDTAKLAMQNGEVDAWIATPSELDVFENNDSFNITNYSEGRVAYARFNPVSPNMQDKEYREGLMYAMNREEIMLAAYSDSDFFDIGYSFLPTNNAYYSEDYEKHDQNVDKAKELTADGPKALKILYVEEDAVQTNQALTIQAELKQVGINVELCGLNQAGYMKAAYDNESTEYDIILGGMVMGVDPDMYAMLFCTNMDDMMNFQNPEIDKLFEKGKATLDEKDRKEIYDELQKKVADEAYFYCFGGNKRTLVTSARVSGMEEAKMVPIYTFGDWAQLKVN